MRLRGANPCATVARWCGACAKAGPELRRAGLEAKGRRVCQDCKRYTSKLGPPSADVPVWCTGCAKVRVAAGGKAVVIGRPMCEDCSLKPNPRFGIPGR